jgi:quinol-cytochrome oxidoreductase complex cytochrome b subunit/mono/diheme cytochrome c family protein
MSRIPVFIVVIVLALGGLLLALAPAQASGLPLATPTFDATRLAPPATVYPPSQADNGAQLYWGMCQSCHGDRGQGMTQEWLNSYPEPYRDCWQSGCHGSDHPANSFEILKTGAPALAGPGRLARFSTAFELQTFIREKMPLFPPGSLTEAETWSLAAYVLRMNGRQVDGLSLSEVNSAAIPIHRDVKVARGGGWAVLLVVVLGLAAAGLGRYAARARAAEALHAPRPNFIHHLHPRTIPAEQARFRYTLALGGLAVFFSLVLLATGLLEMYYYIPTPDKAAVSVQTITYLVPFGGLVRNLHYWSAQFLVIVATLHLLRVVLTGAYAAPRRFNYLLGLLLLVVALLLDFTGYVLRWDEGIRWALVVGTNLLKTIPLFGEALYRFVIGADEPGAATLTRFYAWHIFGLTLAAVILIAWHAFRVRRDGGVAVPPPVLRPERERITRFELVRREVLVMLVAGALLAFFALLVPAPIRQPIGDTGRMAGDSQAPWFFLWVQQLLKLGDPFVWGVLTPLLVVVALGLLPYVLPNARSEELGRWFPRGNRLAQWIAVGILAVILVLTILGAAR